MNGDPEDRCPICNAHAKSCIRCRAGKDSAPKSFLGLPMVSWLILAIGAILAGALLL